MDNEQPVLPPALAAQLIAELRNPAYLLTLETSDAMIVAACRSIQCTTHAVLDIPRADFDRMMAEDGDALIVYLNHHAGIHKGYHEIVDRLVNALMLRKQAPKNM